MDNLYKLTFDRHFDAVLCLQANLPEKDFFSDFAEMPLLAADGSANTLAEMGIAPDYIIGDLDSIDFSFFENNYPKTEIIRLADQETNDFEKCLRFAGEKGFKSILIIGFHGGDLEHTFNNWSVLTKLSREMNLCVLDRNRYGIPLNKSIEMKCKPSEIISLVPQPAAILTTKGLKWRLQSEELSLGIREGARNVALSDKITINIESGSLILFIDSRLPFAPALEAKI